MTTDSLLGARASNAGDDFHVLWVMSYALDLLAPGTDLMTISVEDPAPMGLKGLSGEDKLHGIDCGFYYGGNSFTTSRRVEFGQLKYSSSNPASPWTASRLGPTGDKGPIQSMVATYKKYKDIATSATWTISLISNQPLADDLKWLLPQEESDSKERKGLDRLIKASGMNDQDFEPFLKHLDFTKCGSKSRQLTGAEIKARVIHLTETDNSYSTLRNEVYRLTLPEGKDQVISKANMLTWLGGSEYSLFPAPSTVKLPDDIIPRACAEQVAAYVRDNQVGCIHAAGGYGKTTIVHQIKQHLPSSIFVVYDCYGAGAYLSSDQARHTSDIAIPQIANEIATVVGTGHFLIPESSFTKYARAFVARLDTASQHLSALDSKALLVIVIDAADNAVTAAELKPQQDCFITELTSLSSVPSNVRILFTCRTSRLEDLKLSANIKTLPIDKFSRPETAAYISKHFQNLSEQTIDSLYALTGGIPRVLWYVISFSNNDITKIFQMLGTQGRTIDDLFRVRLKEAIEKSSQIDVNFILPFLSILPRPIDNRILAMLCNTSEGKIREFCNDLWPSVRSIGDSIEMNDEDFEAFMREELKQIPDSQSAEQKITTLLYQHKDSNIYAATHVADFLAKSERFDDLFKLVSGDPSPAIVKDELAKIQVRNRRLQLALRCVDKISDNGRVVEVLLQAAIALKEDKTLVQVLTQNPDLAAVFARDTIEKTLLSKRKFQYVNGPLNFHLSVALAKAGNCFEATVCRERAIEWVIFRNNDPNRQSQYKFNAIDAAAGIYSNMICSGSPAGILQWNRWRHHIFRVQIGIELIEMLAFERTDLLIAITESRDVKDIYKVGAITALLKKGIPVAEEVQQRCTLAIQSGINWKKKPRRPGSREIYLTLQALGIEYLEYTRFSCGLSNGEILAAVEKVVPLSWCIAENFLETSPTQTDLIIRTACLHESLDASFDARSHLLGNPRDPNEPGISTEERTLRRKQDQSLQSSIKLLGFLLPIYRDRLQLMHGSGTEIISSFIEKTSDAFLHNGYHFNRYHFPKLKLTVCQSLCDLLYANPNDKSAFVTSIIEILTDIKEDHGGSNRLALLNRAKWFTGTSDSITKLIHEKIAFSIEISELPANEKTAAYLECCRLLTQTSAADARHYFALAQKVSNEIDEDAFPQIRTLVPLVNQAEFSDASVKRQLAATVGNFTTNSSQRLPGYEVFPWSSAIHAMVKLDPSIALASVSQWHDRKILSLTEGLTNLLKFALVTKNLTPAIATALTELLEHGSSDFIQPLLSGDNNLSSVQRRVIEQVLTRDVLQREATHCRQETATKLLQYLAESSNERRVVEQTIHFLKLNRDDHANSNRKRQTNFPETSGIDLCSPEQLQQLLTTTNAISNASMESTFATIRPLVPVRDRARHLTAVISVCYHSYLPKILSAAFEEWKSSPSVNEWFATELPKYVSNRHGALSLLSNSVAGFSLLIGLIQRTSTEKIKIAVDLIANHMDAINPDQVYRTISIIAANLTPQEASNATKDYSKFLNDRVDFANGVFKEVIDVPTTTEHSVARFIYSMLGDPDKEVRWKAAHAVRTLIRLHESNLVKQVIAIACELREDNSFRFRYFPFYWLAAMESLTMAIHRSSIEFPDQVALLSEDLYKLVTTPDVFHAAVQFYIKQTILNCNGADSKNITKQHLKEVKQLLTVNLQKPPSDYKYPWYGSSGTSKKWRFRFDTDDTLSFWYKNAARLFLIPSERDFADDAEKIILDEWKVKVDERGSPSRARQFEDHDYPKLRHSSGDLSQIEDYQTYLEYHAMMSVAGRYAKEFPVLQEGNANDFNEWLEEHVIARPYWLSDLKTPRPLQKHLWPQESANLREWINGIDSALFSSIFPTSVSESTIPVYASETISTKMGIETIEIESALVGLDTSRSLVNVITTAVEPSRFRIPTEGDRHTEIKARPFVLKGWIREIGRSYPVDQFDPRAQQLDNTYFVPGKDVTATLQLHQRADDNLSWIAKKNRSTQTSVLSLTRWSDWIENRHEELGTFGNRLVIHRDYLLKYLKAVNMNLIIRVSVDRKEHYKTYRSENHETLKEKKYQIHLFNQNGEITTQEGIDTTGKGTR